MTNEKSVLEAALFVAGKSLSINELAKLCGLTEKEEVKKQLQELVEEYRQRNSGIEIYTDGKNYGMRVKVEIEDRVAYLIPQSDLGSGTLKTLAFIAYKQPLTQSALVKKRGNRCYYYIKKLLEQELIEAKKHGRTKLLKTTPKFNQYFRIKSVDELEVKEPLKPAEVPKTEEKPEEKTGEEKVPEDLGKIDAGKAMAE